MNYNLPSRSTSFSEHQSSTNLNLSVKNKSIMMSLISEYSKGSGLFKSVSEIDKQKCEAITNALEVIDKLSINISLQNTKINELNNEISKQNETIQGLETKNIKFNNKNNELKTKMENSSKDYTANINKKNDTIKELEQRNIQTIKERAEFQTKQVPNAVNICSGGNQSISINPINDSKLNKDEAFKEKYLSTNRELQERDKQIVKLNEEVGNLQAEIGRLKDENRNQNNEIKSLKGKLNDCNLSCPVAETS